MTEVEHTNGKERKSLCLIIDDIFLTAFDTFIKQALPDEAQPVDKIHPFSKITVTFELIQQF